MNDSEHHVRVEIILQLYNLDRYDFDSDIRCEVIRQEYGLDILASDSRWEIREAVCEIKEAIQNN